MKSKKNVNKLYCPLVGFNLNWDVNFDNNEFDVDKDIKIISKRDLPDLSILSDYLTKIDIYYYQNTVKYWLCLSYNFNMKQIEKIINLFQLALWTIKPTELKVEFISNLLTIPRKLKWRKVSPRFSFILGFSEESINNNDLDYVKRIFPIMMNLYKKKRYRNSIVFNYQGCITTFWEDSYISFSTTFESLLNHNTHINNNLQKLTRWGVKKKLAWAYAILTEADNEKRQIAFENFRDIYKIRSEILHGESFKDKFGKGEINLKELAKCRDMLRKLWQVILDSEEIIENLSCDDGVRRKYFKKVANGWMPEEENGQKG